MGAGLDWLEFSVTVDGEAAEAIVELFNRFGHGGAVIELPVDCFENELSSTLLPPMIWSTFCGALWRRTLG